MLLAHAKQAPRGEQGKQIDQHEHRSKGRQLEYGAHRDLEPRLVVDSLRRSSMAQIDAHGERASVRGLKQAGLSGLRGRAGGIRRLLGVQQIDAALLRLVLRRSSP